MPIRLRWYDATQRIWCQEFEGRWTLEEYAQAAALTYQAIDSAAPRPVYIVSNIVGPLHLPYGIIPKLHQDSLQVRANERLNVIIGGGVIVRSLYSNPFVRRLNPHLRLVASFEEALKLIEEAIAHDKTLPEVGAHSRPRR